MTSSLYRQQAETGGREERAHLVAHVGNSHVRSLTVTATLGRTEIREITSGKYGARKTENLQAGLENLSYTSQKRSYTACSGMPATSHVLEYLRVEVLHIK